MDSANRFNNMKSVNKLICQEVGNDEYMIVCNFGSRRMNGFEVIEREGGREGGGRAPMPLPVTGNKKKPGLNRVTSS